MADDATVLREMDGPVAILRLNRPNRLNAFDAATLQLLIGEVQGIACDPAVRAVVLTGVGRAFSAGGDLKATVEGMNLMRPGDAFYRMAPHFHQLVMDMKQCNKPILGAINGPAAGGGFSLALACDLRFVAESATFQQSYTSRGLTLDGGGSFSLPRLVGMARAMEICLLDEPISARQALEWGLATRVYPDAELLPRTLDIARQLAAKSSFGLGRTKQLLLRSLDTNLERQLEEERLGISACANSPEGMEGLLAFVEKRPPDFPAALTRANS